MVAEGDIVLDKLDQWALRAPDKVFIHYGETGIASPSVSSSASLTGSLRAWQRSA